MNMLGQWPSPGNREEISQPHSLPAASCSSMSGPSPPPPLPPLSCASLAVLKPRKRSTAIVRSASAHQNLSDYATAESPASDSDHIPMPRAGSTMALSRLCAPDSPPPSLSLPGTPPNQPHDFALPHRSGVGGMLTPPPPRGSGGRSSRFKTGRTRRAHATGGSGHHGGGQLIEPVNIMHPTKVSGPKAMRRAIFQTFEGYILGLQPRLASEGMGGAYFMPSRYRPCVAVFKPSDEEPMAPNNPRGLGGVLGSTGIKRGVRSGEAAVREYAAFLLDHGGVAGVPPTALVSIPTGDWRSRPQDFFAGGGGRRVGRDGHSSCVASASTHGDGSVADGEDGNGAVTSQTGSLQVFVESKCCAGDLGSSNFAVMEVQAIALLDMRLFNVDRHDGNLLVQQQLSDEGDMIYVLRPIDHGFCLPDTPTICAYDWCWFTWPQVKQPLMPALRRYILSLNSDADARLLSDRLGVREKCVLTFRLTTRFVQTVVARCPDIHVCDLAALMSRTGEEDDSSELERIVARSRWRAAMAVVCNHASSLVTTVASARAQFEIESRTNGDDMCVDQADADTAITNVQAVGVRLNRGQMVMRLLRSLFRDAFWREFNSGVDALCGRLGGSSPKPSRSSKDVKAVTPIIETQPPHPLADAAAHADSSTEQNDDDGSCGIASCKRDGEQPDSLSPPATVVDFSSDSSSDSSAVSDRLSLRYRRSQ